MGQPPQTSRILSAIVSAVTNCFKTLCLRNLLF